MGKKQGVAGVAVVALPILEVAALVLVGNALGFFRTIALFVLLSIIGLSLLRLRLAQVTSAAGSVASEAGNRPSMGSSVIAAIGALLLMIPGFITALVGALLQLPPLRAALAHRVNSTATTYVSSMGGGRFGRGDVIDTDLSTDTQQPDQGNQQSAVTIPSELT